MKNIRALTWIAGIVIIAAMFLLVVHLSSNNMEFSRYNSGWNGTSSFFFDLDRHHVSDIRDPDQLYGHPGNTTLLIIAPHRAPTTEELGAYAIYLRDGNTIFLADDFGSGNAILAGISRITILPGNLSSLDRAYPDPYSVVVYRAVNDSPLNLPESLALNRPAGIEGGSSLVLTSVMSWNDANGDKRYTRGENMGTFPVMTMESVGNGRIIVFSDPSIFINSMYTQSENGNNRIFIRDLTSRDDAVLIDQMNSRTADTSGFSEILHVIRNTIMIEILIIGLLMLGIAWAWKKKAM